MSLINCGTKKYEIYDYNGEYIYEKTKNSINILEHKKILNGNPYGRFTLTTDSSNKFTITSESGVVSNLSNTSTTNDKTLYEILINTDSSKALKFSIETSDVNDYVYISTQINDNKYYLASIYFQDDLLKKAGQNDLIIYNRTILVQSSSRTNILSDFTNKDLTNNGLKWKLECVDDSSLAKIVDKINYTFDSLWTRVGFPQVKNIGVYIVTAIIILIIIIIFVVILKKPKKKKQSKKKYDEDDDYDDDDDDNDNYDNYDNHNNNNYNYGYPYYNGYGYNNSYNNYYRPY